MVRKLEVDVDEEVLNVHFQIFNPKEIENIKAKGWRWSCHLKIWATNIKKIVIQLFTCNLIEMIQSIWWICSTNSCYKLLKKMVIFILLWGKLLSSINFLCLLVFYICFFTCIVFLL